MLLLFGYGRSLIDQLPDIWSIRGSSSIKTKAYLVLVDAVAKIFLLFRPTQRIMTCNDPQLQLAWYLVDAVAMLLRADATHRYTSICMYNVHHRAGIIKSSTPTWYSWYCQGTWYQLKMALSHVIISFSD